MKSRSLRPSTTALAPLLAATLFAAAPAFADPGRFHGGMSGDLVVMERLASKLELTDQQRTEFERIMDGARDQARPYVKQMIASRKSMDALLDADTFDEAAIRAQARSSSSVMTELAIIQARSRYELRQILTPEQREKLKSRHHSRMPPE